MKGDRQRNMASRAILGDRFAAGGMVAIVTAEAARGVHMPEVVGIRSPVDLQVREHVLVVDHQECVSRCTDVAGPFGTLAVYQSRVSTDQVAGFASSMKKGIGRSVMAKQLTDILQRSRDSFQQRRSVPRSP